MNSRFMQTVLTEDVCDTDTGLGEVLVVNCEYSGFSLRVGAYFFARGAGAYRPPRAKKTSGLVCSPRETPRPKRKKKRPSGLVSGFALWQETQIGISCRSHINKLASSVCG